jgi:hypothetical protein
VLLRILLCSFGFRLQDFHLLWFIFPDDSTILYCHVMESYNPDAAETTNGLGSFPFARHYSGNHFCFLFLRVLRCFTSPGWLPFGYPASGMGYPIRKSADIRLLTSSRSLSQLSHVLHRLLVPRHPPYALSNLTKNLLLMSISHINRKGYKFTK